MVEVLAVIVILGIIAGIAFPSVMGMIERSKRDVCHVNLLDVERMYEAQLDLESAEHGDVGLVTFLQEYDKLLCPSDGEIRYVDGVVECSIHSH